MNYYLNTDTNTPQTNQNLQWRYLAKCSTKEARSLIPYNLALKHCVLPISVFEIDDERLISLLTSKALNLVAVQELKFVSGCRVNLDYTDNASLYAAIKAAYDTEDQKLISAVENSNKLITKENEEHNIDNEAAIPNLLKRILQRAELLSASDIHLEPFQKRFRIRFRVCGELIEEKIANLEKQVGKNLIRCIKVKSKIENMHGPCDGKFSIPGLAGIKEIRVSVLPLAEEDKVVLRLFGNELLTKDYFSLPGLNQMQRHILEAALNIDSGAIFVAGPTGSGKSTMLYSCLRSLDLAKMNVISVEDPIEHRIDGVAQIDLSLTKNLTYAKVLPYVLRQDPDILMLGEVRDAQTANLAFEAALTGKLILSTVHCANSLETIFRLIKLGICQSALANSLKLIISGRLIATNCKNCAQRELLPQRFIDFFEIDSTHYYFSAGCEDCFHTSYSGRIAAYEFLPITNNIRARLLEAKHYSAEDFKQLALAEGYQPYTKQILHYLAQGFISFDSACKSLGISRNLFQAQ